MQTQMKLASYINSSVSCLHNLSKEITNFYLKNTNIVVNVKFARRFVPGKFSQNDPWAQASRYLFELFCEISQCFFQAISNAREDNHDSSTA